jgi:hypothetical protein
MGRVRVRYVRVTGNFSTALDQRGELSYGRGDRTARGFTGSAVTGAACNSSRRSARCGDCCCHDSCGYSSRGTEDQSSQTEAAFLRRERCQGQALRRASEALVRLSEGRASQDRQRRGNLPLRILQNALQAGPETNAPQLHVALLGPTGCSLATRQVAQALLPVWVCRLPVTAQISPSLRLQKAHRQECLCYFTQDVPGIVRIETGAIIVHSSLERGQRCSTVVALTPSRTSPPRGRLTLAPSSRP